jgi:hypothetical protein
MDAIDWTPFDGLSESECACHCGAVFRSHAKTVVDNGRWTAVSRRPCPDCGKADRLRRISSDPERFTLGDDR